MGRGSDYRPGERSGGVFISCSGTYIRKVDIVECTVTEKAPFRCRHDYMESDIGNIRFEFDEGAIFSGKITDEGFLKESNGGVECVLFKV